MATFTVDDSDIEELVRRDLWDQLRHQGVLPLAAFLVALVLSWVHILLGTMVFGMGLAWSYSLVVHLRSVRPWYRSHHGSLAGPLTVDLRADGLHTEMPVGSGTVRWDQLSGIRNYPGCFVLENDGEQILILPKRHFTTEELIFLQSKADEVTRRTTRA